MRDLVPNGVVIAFSSDLWLEFSITQGRESRQKIGPNKHQVPTWSWLIQSGSAKIKLKNESKITLDIAENIDKRSAVAKLLNELL